MLKRTMMVMLAVVSVSLSAVATPVFAHGDRNATNATSGNDSGSSTSHAYQWPTNGCTAVPDSTPGVFYFNHACDHHDGCYGGHWKSRLGCDNQFYDNMESSCTYNWAWWNPARVPCRAVKNTYYNGVRALGYVAYNGWSISGPSGW